jgi:hypothetical protein
MCMYDRRLQILLDEPRYRRVHAIARERKTSVAAVIREAIDLLAPEDLAKKRAAWKRLKEAKPIPVPQSTGELTAELEEIRSWGL